ncbi:MAG: LTA synthase family protein [Bacteroidales bacterium]|nr:LTA synthase family protein [Bacteroidales bacterium]
MNRTDRTDFVYTRFLRQFAAWLCNIVLAYVVYMLCRVAYVWENWSLFAPGWEALSWSDLLRGSLRFDTAAIAYTLIPYTLLMLLPVPLAWRQGKRYRMVCKWVFVVTNALAVVVNLCDAVYSQYTGRRTTSSFFSEFQNDGNLAQIFGIELLRHWYLVLAGAALIVLLWVCYAQPCRNKKTDFRARWDSLWGDIPLLALVAVLAVGGMRGGFSKAIRPIAVSNANQYVNSPQEAAIVLNTPFTLIRTAGKTTFTDPSYYDRATLDSIYTPVHSPAPQTMDKRNVVVLIVESFAMEYIGGYNSYRGYTPFIDSLMEQSLTFRCSYANGRKSIDGMPSVLSSIPMFVEPFFVTHYSLNRLSGLAGELAKEGYATAFFHGAENGSMGFQAFARATGFQHYYGRSEYDQDPRFNGDGDFDGTWAIWDEPFLQYYALTMSQMPEPFMTAVFTASSHHPFVVPDRYRDSLHEEGHPIYTCIRYADLSLRRFFETAKRQPWYENTLFVITADHTNISEQASYLTDIGRYRVPIIFFDPSGRMPRGHSNAIAQQIDIMPTLLGFMGYGRPYLAFGKDLLHTPADSTWAVNYNNGIYQYCEGPLILQHDGHSALALYNLHNDSLLTTNLIGHQDLAGVQQHMEQQLKAIMQSYMQRMIEDQLTYD